MKIRLREIRGTSMSHPGMWSDFLTAGKLSGDKQTIEIAREDFDAINDRHFGPHAIGTVIHEVLKPAVKVVDRIAGTDLASCGGCAKRQLLINSLTG